MTREEFLELFSKGQENVDNKFIEAIDSIINGSVASDDSVAHEAIDILSYVYDALEHYGIEGQKWGVQNGPPYPLSRSKKSRLRKQDKAKILLDNIDDLSIDEIRNLITRIDFEEKLENMTKEEKKQGKSYVEKILQKSGDAILSSVVPAATTFAFKKLVASVAGEEVVNEMFPKKK